MFDYDYIFDYLKNKLNEEIELAKLNYNRKLEEKKDIADQMKIFADFKELKNELDTNKISLGFWISSLVIVFAAAILFNSSTIMIVLGGLAALCSSLKIAKYYNEVSDTKLCLKEVEKKCLEIAKDVLNNDKTTDLKLSKEVINDVNSVLNHKMDENENVITSINNLIIEDKYSLSFFEAVESVIEFLSNESMICTENLNNEKNVIESYKQKCICDNNSLDKYLEEPIDYSNIHFNNKIGESIDYTENSKKLLKKM